MRHTSRQNKSSSTTRGIAAALALIALFMGGNYVTGGAFSNSVRSVLAPVVGSVSSLGGGVGSLGDYFTSKTRLLAENEQLKKYVAELERAAPADRLATFALASRDTLAETLAMFETGQYAGKPALLADVVSYVDYPFGTLLVQFRTLPTNTAPGQVRYMFSEDGTCIGVLDSFGGSSGVVRLFSRAGSEQQMRIGNSELALVTGKGGVTMQAVVPKSTKLDVGDPVSLPEAGNSMVGIVGEITALDTDTTQLVLIRLAASPRDVHTVIMFE